MNKPNNFLTMSVEELKDYTESFTTLLRRLEKTEKIVEEMTEFLLHLYANYKLPYGPMDVETKKRFEELISKGWGTWKE